MSAARLSDALSDVLRRPRGKQAAALLELRRQLPQRPEPEQWNSRFGDGSLFDAWTRSSLVQRLHEANAAVLRPWLAERPGFRVMELGGGDGRLWSLAMPPDAQGQLIVIDPIPEVATLIADRLPPGVELHFIPARAETLCEPGSAFEIGDLDACVVSLTLHHVAGRDRVQRQAHGLTGPGKVEVLSWLAGGLALREGVLLVNEADVHCDLDLPAGDPLLTERLLDSYVRRCAQALLDDVATRQDADADLRARWEAVVLHWCIEQVDLAAAPVAQRDVYELDVVRWRQVFVAAGLEVLGEVFTDQHALFRQYRLGASPTPGSAAAAIDPSPLR